MLTCRGMRFAWLVFGMVISSPAEELSYNIQAQLSGNTISGQVEIVYRNRTGKPLIHIPMELPAKTNVRFGEHNVVAGEDGPQIELTTPLAPGSELRVAGRFRGALASRNGYRFARDWHPRVVPFIGGRFDREEREPARFEVTLEAPRREIIASSGRVEAEESLKYGSRRLRLRSEPISSFGIAASPDFRVVEKSAGGVTIREYQLPKSAVWNAKNFADTGQQVIAFYRETFGEYPHGSLAILPGSRNATGGFAMAGNMVQIHQDFAPHHVSPGFERWIVAHEIGHMLWGYETVLDLARYNHWLGLGLGIYSDRLFMTSRTEFGERFQRLFLDRYLGGVAGHRDTRLTQPWAELRREPYDSNSVVSHGKGFAVVQMLEQVMGSDLFLKLLRTIQGRYRWRHITVAQFKAEAEAVFGGSLAWFFSDWVENDRILRVEIESVRVLDNGTAEITVLQTGTARMPIVCQVERQDGTRSRMALGRESERQTVRVTGSGPVRLVRLDPDSRLPLVGRNSKSYHGRPWIVLRREGATVVARNESRQEHEVELWVGESKSYRIVIRRIPAGGEIAIALPGKTVRITARDATDNVALSLE